MSSQAYQFRDGTVVQVRMGAGTTEDHEAINLAVAGPPATNHLASWFSAGGPERIFDAYEMLRREVNALNSLVDSLLVGHRHGPYAGNLAVVSRVRASSIIAQHLENPTVDDNDPLQPALHVFQSVHGETTSVEGNRPAMLLERWSRGDVTTAQALLALRKRLADGATDDGAWIADDVGQTFAIVADGTYFTRGGFFAISGHAIVHDGHFFADSGNALVALGPGTTTESLTGTSVALARLAGSAAQLGDIYGNDIDLTVQGDIIALPPSGADSEIRSDSYTFRGNATRPACVTSWGYGLWAKNTGELYLYNGTTDLEIPGSGSGGLTEWCGYPSWSQDLGTMFPDRVYNWGPFGNADWPGFASAQPTQGHESDGSRQTSYVAALIGDDPTSVALAFSCGVPEGFSAWDTDGLTIATKVTGVTVDVVVTLTAYNPSTGATSTATRTVSTDDTAYVETSITPPGTWQGLDLLRFTISFATTDGSVTCKVGRIRTDWS